MPDKLPVTVLVAARNEEVNILRCVNALLPASRIIVIDSQSTDRTCAIAEKAGAETVQFRYAGGYPKKRQWAMDTLEIETPWVFLVDADEAIPETLWHEIGQAISRKDAPTAFLIRKGFHFMGRRFRFGGFSHDAVLLFRKGTAQFEELTDSFENLQDMEVHERLIVDGTIDRLKTPLIHEDLKGISAYLERHNLYSGWEARVRSKYLASGSFGSRTIQPSLTGNVQERRRFLKTIAIRMPFEPVLWFLYHYVFRLGFLEGKPGFVASRIRAGYIRQVRSKMCNFQKTGTSSA